MSSSLILPDCQWKRRSSQDAAGASRSDWELQQEGMNPFAMPDDHALEVDSAGWPLQRAASAPGPFDPYTCPPWFGGVDSGQLAVPPFNAQMGPTGLGGYGNGQCSIGLSNTQMGLQWSGGSCNLQGGIGGVPRGALEPDPSPAEIPAPQPVEVPEPQLVEVSEPRPEEVPEPQLPEISLDPPPKAEIPYELPRERMHVYSDDEHGQDMQQDEQMPGRAFESLKVVSGQLVSDDAMHIFENCQGQQEVTLVSRVGAWCRIYRFGKAGSGGSPRLVASISLPLTNLKLPPGLLPYFNADVLDYNITSFARSSDGVTLCFGCRAGRLLVYTFNEARREPLRLDLQLVLGKGEHINCVRFMTVDGQEYIVVADEGMRVWMFANPNTRESSALPIRLGVEEYAEPPFAGLNADAEPNWRQCSEYRTVSIYDQIVDEARYIATIGPFTTVCKSIQPSPKGAFLAVLSDDGVVILQKKEGFRYSRPPRHWEEDAEGPVTGSSSAALRLTPHPLLDSRWTHGFSQGLAWNADETLLAVVVPCSWKNRYGIEVWGAPTATCRRFRQLLRIQETCLSPLAVTFSPVKPGLMAFCELKKAIHVLDVYKELETGIAPSPVSEQEAKSLQSLTCTTHIVDEESSITYRCSMPIGHLRNLAFTVDNQLFAATSDGLLHFEMPGWSFESHKFYPACFKKAAECLLMCARKDRAAPASPTRGEKITTLQDLPMDAVVQCIQILAASYTPQSSQCASVPKLTWSSVARGYMPNPGSVSLCLLT